MAGLGDLIKNAVNTAYSVTSDLWTDVVLIRDTARGFNTGTLAVDKTTTTTNLKALLYDHVGREIAIAGLSAQARENAVSVVRKALIRAVDLPAGVIPDNTHRISIAGSEKDILDVEQVPGGSVFMLILAR